MALRGDTAELEGGIGSPGNEDESATAERRILNHSRLLWRCNDESESYSRGRLQRSFLDDMEGGCVH